MRTALIAIGIVVVILVGFILTLRSSAKTGMPSEDVLKRASERARDLAAREENDDT